MPRIFYGNFDFEESLARPQQQQRSRSLQRILAELATAWVAVAERDDLIWCPLPVDASFLDRLTDAGWPPLRLVWRREEIPSGCEIVPWGWTPEAIAWGESVAATFTAPSLDVVRTVNSRQFSFDREQALGIVLSGSTAVSTLDELLEAIEIHRSLGQHWLIKTEFSQAGRDRFKSPTVGICDLNRLESWARSRLQHGQRLYVEPWLDAVAEVGLQYDISPERTVTSVGHAQMLASQDGSYAGSVVTSSTADSGDWADAMAVGRQVAEVVAAQGYFGPLGIDAMRYRQPDGSLALRAIQDVNARWTMGRLSLGLSRFVAPTDHARWLHGRSADDWPDRNPLFSRHRILHTSPETVNGQSVKHRSALIIN